ncbi:MAG: hypothetical protein JNL18_18725 [Planctomycetaceae bacterium]|nr:hypothetical protein [Planctomycetaceae bacterium]
MSKYPIIVRRWFREGNSFAFHPSVTSSEIGEIGRDIHSVGYDNPLISLEFSKGRRLIGELTPEGEFLDKDTIHRGCNVVKLILVPDGKVSEIDALIAIREAPLPKEGGPNPTLLAHVGAVRELCPTTIDHARAVTYLIACAFALFASAVLVFPFSGFASDFVGCFSLGLLFAGALLSEGLSLPNARIIEAHEMAVYRSSRDQRPLPRRMFDARTKVVIVDNAVDNGPFSLDGRLPFELGDAEYLGIAVTPTQWTCVGIEVLTMPDGSHQKATFVRVFVRKWQRWVLRYASWIVHRAELDARLN